MPKMQKKNGRPTKYDPSYAEEVEKICLLGATVEQVADFFNVCENTVLNWQKEHPEFLEAIQRAKLKADLEVSASLYAKARAGDTTACIFWLKNRRPNEWRDRHQIDMKAQVQAVSIDFSAFSDQELAQYEALTSKALQSAPKTPETIN